MAFKVGDKVRFSMKFIKEQEGSELTVVHIRKRLEERTVEDVSSNGEVRLYKQGGCWLSFEYFEPYEKISENELKESSAFLKQYDILKKIWN